MSALLLMDVTVGECRRNLLQEYSLEAPTLEESSAVNTLEEPRANTGEEEDMNGELRGRG